MSKFLSLITVLILTFSTVQISIASPLVFKITKEVKNEGSKDFVELITFETSKYKQVRIGVIAVSGKPNPLNFIQVHAVEVEDLIFLQGSDLFSSKSILIDSPPTKIRISVQQSGTYKVFIWAN